MSEHAYGVRLIDDISQTVPFARRMEELGFAFVGSGEHLMMGSPPRPTARALTVLAVAAGATERLRLITSVMLLPMYHPATLAKETAVLDVASGGRLTLGVGVGGEFPQEFEAAGIPPRERGSRANEILEVLPRLWAEEGVTHRGRHFQLDNITLKPTPLQCPGPPIWVAGRREPAMRRAVRYGNGWFPYFYSPERYKSSVDQVRQMAAEDGRDLSSFTWGLFQYISIYGTVREAAEHAAQHMGGRYRYSGDFASIVGQYCVLGPPDACVSRIKEYIQAGARHIHFSWGGRREDIHRAMEVLSKEIVPQLPQGQS